MKGYNLYFLTVNLLKTYRYSRRKDKVVRVIEQYGEVIRVPCIVAI